MLALALAIAQDAPPPPTQIVPAPKSTPYKPPPPVTMIVPGYDGAPYRDPLTDQSVEELRSEIARKQWVAFYLLALKLLDRGETEEAAFWFYVGQMRGRAYVICHAPAADGAPAVLASLNSVVGTPINEHLYGSIRRTVAVIDRALAWEASHADPNLPLPKCADALELARADKRKQRELALANAAEIRSVRARNGLSNEPE